MGGMDGMDGMDRWMDGIGFKTIMQLKVMSIALCSPTQNTIAGRRSWRATNPITVSDDEDCCLVLTRDEMYNCNKNASIKF